MARLVDTLRSHRLVTLTGVGGVGKTRLALHSAAELAPAYRGGAWLVELAPVGDPAAIGHAIAAVLGITQQPGRTIEESMVEALRFRHVLVVLDNCEHLIDEVANLAAEVLEHCPDVTIVATSREALMIEGEQAWAVPSLSYREGAGSPAVTLFAERAAAIDRSFDAAVDAGAVSEICRRLDGIPLAIELAAARVRSMSPAQIRDRLGERFRLLTGGSRRALERHQTLRHAVQWSYDLLSATEQRLLGRLSVFAGGFTLEAAEEVCGGADLPAADVDDLLDSLVRKSLVTTERAGRDVRYGLLETIRQFAEEQLGNSGESEATRDRHARYFARAAAANYNVFMSPRQREGIEWFERELDNLRSAFRWSLDRGDAETAARIAVEAGQISWLAGKLEPVLWATDALDATRAAESATLPDLLAVAACCHFLGQYEEACRYAREAIGLVERARQKVRSTLPWCLLGMGSSMLGRLDDAEEAYRAGAGRPEESPWPLCGQNLAALVSAMGRADAGGVLAETLLAPARSSAIPAVEAFGLFYWAWAHESIDLDGAIRALEDSARIARTHRATFLEAIASRELAGFVGRRGEVRRALAGLLATLETFQASGDWFNAGIVLYHLCLVLDRAEYRAAVAVLSGYVAEITVVATQRELFRAAVERCRGQLGEPEFERLAAVGRAMRPWDLVAFATEQIQLALAELGSAGGDEDEVRT